MDILARSGRPRNAADAVRRRFSRFSGIARLAPCVRRCDAVVWRAMPSSPHEFDFWYAVNNTEVLELPRGRLETFGSTLINYHLVTELMDAVGQVRVREGRIQSFRPEILTPQSFSESPLEGFQAAKPRISSAGCASTNPT
jgi:hypothetical protein